MGGCQTMCKECVRALLRCEVVLCCLSVNVIIFLASIWAMEIWNPYIVAQIYGCVPFFQIINV